ncbi:MAG TPA: bacterio-opsin activator domain-containing protein [Natronoarchaeum rubrum]|nr:bacterio-opsin activator domain-containing protein [Natronoarchaeum rubrum]
MACPSDGGDCVLYVDADARATETVVAAFGDAAVETATTAADARRALLEEPVDCVISEHQLPESDGIDLLNAVRDRYPTLPVVLFVGDGDEALASAALSAGVTEYVIKEPLPDGVDRLVETVSDLLDRRQFGRRTAIDAIGDADGDLPPALKERAMDEAPVGITIADARAEDMPLVYVNEAFERLTGYDRAATLGRNCRFLQGPATASEPVDRMRAAIDTGESASEVLVNYRRDGRMFWNRVDLAPVYDGEELAYYVGFQTDVTQRKRAEFAARRRADALEAERRSLKELLDRLDGLVLDVTGALVHASGREELLRRVCERVGDAEPYDFAWIGEYNVASDRVRPAACSAGDVQFGDGHDVDFGAETPVGAAIEEREFRVVQDGSGDPDGLPVVGWPEGSQSMAAVPLTDRGRLYGVLCVYASDPDAFEDHERAILTALGRTVAATINARENEERLTADVVAELEFDVVGSDLLLVSLAAELDCRVEYAGSVRADDGALLAFVDVADAAPDRLADAAARRPTVASTTILSESDEGCLAEFELAEPFVVEVLAELGVETRSIVADPDGSRLTVRVSETEDARAVVDRIEKRLPGVDFAAYRERDRPAETRREFVARVERRLTDRQQSALRRAYLSDYFERPRSVSGDELADSMGVSRSTFHQHLRAAQRKLVEAFYEERADPAD